MTKLLRRPGGRMTPRREKQRLRQEIEEGARGLYSTNEGVVCDRAEAPARVAKRNGKKDESGSEAVFIPQLLEEGELPEIASSSLRLLINLTATGQDTPLELKERLKDEPLDGVYRAISAGIRRWHIHGKEKE